MDVCSAVYATVVLGPIVSPMSDGGMNCGARSLTVKVIGQLCTAVIVPGALMVTNRCSAPEPAFHETEEVLNVKEHTEANDITVSAWTASGMLMVIVRESPGSRRLVDTVAPL